MSVAAFDTLKYAKHLRDAGVSDAQAEAQVAALAEALQAGIQELATKRDIADVKREIADIKRDIAELAQSTKRDIAEGKQEWKQELKQVEMTLRHEFQQLHANERADRIVVRWMFGVLMTTLLSVLGLMLRFMVFK
jgi:hypothetical protein